MPVGRRIHKLDYVRELPERMYGEHVCHDQLGLEKPTGRGEEGGGWGGASCPSDALEPTESARGTCGPQSSGAPVSSQHSNLETLQPQRGLELAMWSPGGGTVHIKRGSG